MNFKSLMLSINWGTIHILSASENTSVSVLVLVGFIAKMIHTEK